MRRNRLLAGAALLLAACGSEEKAADLGVNEARPAPGNVPVPAPATATPRPTPAKEDSIPAAFHGVYDATAEGCAGPSDGRLAVTARELRFHESVGSVRRVASQSPASIRVEADYQGEGERWRSSRELRLSREGAKLTISGDGTSFDRIRCPVEAL